VVVGQHPYHLRAVRVTGEGDSDGSTRPLTMGQPVVSLAEAWSTDLVTKVSPRLHWEIAFGIRAAL